MSIAVAVTTSLELWLSRGRGCVDLLIDRGACVKVYLWLFTLGRVKLEKTGHKKTPLATSKRGKLGRIG